MRCPRCGNEVGPDEAFCGLCGTPMSAAGQPTEMVNIPAPRNGFPGTYIANNANYPNMSPVPPGQAPYPSQVPPSNVYTNTTRSAPPSGSLVSNQPNQQGQQGLGQAAGAFGPQQQSGFYQDATEAMTSLPANRGQRNPGAYTQQQAGFTGTQGQSGYAGGGQYNAQVPFSTTNYPPSATPVGQGFSGYGTPSQPTPPPKKQTSGVLVFAIVCLLVALIAVSAFGAIYLLRNHNPKTAVAPTAVPTVAITPTTLPSPTPSPVPTSTPTPVLSPTVPPTPTPDANFAWCSSCTANGFLIEFPQGWNQTNDGASTNIRFTNPSVSDQYAEFKTPGATTSTASQLVSNDLQTTFASQPGYTAPTGSLTTTIGGENWIYETAYYQLNGQQEQVQVYATVHQQNAYIIELQAATSQFSTVNSQYFVSMLGRFQFQQPGA